VRVPRVEKIDADGNSANTAIVDLNTVSEASNSQIGSLPISLARFVPSNYSMLDTSSGDLNLDPYPDMIMVLRKSGADRTSDVVEHPEKRPLLVLLGGADPEKITTKVKTVKDFGRVQFNRFDICKKD
jgi:hypothetical protein